MAPSIVKAGSTLLFACLFIAFTSGSAFALDMEYYTYNGFDAIVSAFQKIALIFSDNGYKTLFFSAMVLTLLFGGLSIVIRALGGKFSPAAWAAPIGIGFILYMSLILPKANLTIYDPVKNRFQTVGDLPQGIVFMAGMLNLVERGLVDIVTTTSIDGGYQAQAGGVGFDMILGLGTNGVLLTDKNIHASLKKYSYDCLMFELARTGTMVNPNLVASNTDFPSIFAEGANNAVYTVYYDGNGDRTMTCAEAWNNINAAIQSYTTFEGSLKTQCANAGFDPTNSSEVQQCRNTMENTVSWLEGLSFSIMQLEQQVLLAQTMADTFASASPEVAAKIYGDRNIGNSMMGSGVAANSWIPIIRAVVTAIAIGLIPFMVIFIPTSLCGRAVGIIAGFFIWLTAWGVTDAIVHQFAMDYGKKVFEEVTRHELGMVAVLNFSTAGAKTMAAFGAIRWSGMMLATVITGALIKFGGSAMAHLSGQLSGSASSAGQQAGVAAGTPEGRADTQNKLEWTPSVMANAYKFSNYMDRANVHTMERTGKTKYGQEMTGSFGGVDGASDLIAAASTGRAVKFGAAGLAIQSGPGGVRGGLNRHLFDSRVNETVLGNMQKIYGNDAQGLANRRTAAEETFVRMARENGMSPADMQRGFSQLDFGSTMNFVDKYANKTGQSFTESARQLGEIMGSQKYVGAAGYDKARGVVGEEGMVFTGSNKHLNEAAKFEMAYTAAHNLGTAKSKEDFTGMYEAHKMRHGEDGFTLDSTGAANLNRQMKEQGLATKFRAGDRVSLAFDKDGKFTGAYGKSGASNTRLDLTENRTGYRGEHGYQDTTYNYKRTQGVEWKPTGKDKDGKETYGWVVNDAYYNKDNGELVSETWTNRNTGQVTGVEWVDTGKRDDEGNAIKIPQYFTGTVQYNRKGAEVISNKSSISEKESEKNGYHTVQKIAGATGQPVYEVNRRGQDATDVNKLTIDRQTEFRGTVGHSVVAGNEDMTNVSEGQVGAITFLGGFERSVQIVGRGVEVGKNTGLIKPGAPGKAGQSPHLGSKDYQDYYQKVQGVRSEKMNHQQGNYGTRPAPAKTVKPRSVEID